MAVKKTAFASTWETQNGSKVARGKQSKEERDIVAAVKKAINDNLRFLTDQEVNHTRDADGLNLYDVLYRDKKLWLSGKGTTMGGSYYADLRVRFTSQSRPEKLIKING
eukprot:2862724-Amphidinium_carterae.3